MLSLEGLKELLKGIDGKRFSTYKRLKGIVIDYRVAKARFTKVQPDPHAPPSIIEVVISKSSHGFPKELLTEPKSVPLTDYLARALYVVLRRLRRKCGTGYSCYLGIPKPGPWILKRSCVEVCGDDLILRWFIGLPARGRRVLGREARNLLLNDVPKVINSITSLKKEISKIERHVNNYLDQEFVRSWLCKNGYVAFIVDGSVLPRESSISERPMPNAVPFKSPKSLRVTIRLPSGKSVSGMAIPKGFTVITGGGYHGKTTLLESIQEGIYNHIEGDGRELVVSRGYTILVKAEDGRLVHHVDISTFISKLPSGDDTRDFTTLDASGSTSMAASINEAIELGAEVLLIDEDTSATNLLFKDEVMYGIIREEPIRPLSRQVRDLIKKTGTSVIAVVSASPSLLRYADHVVLMENYIPQDITEKVKEVLKGLDQEEYSPPRVRVFKGIKGLKKVRAKGFKIVTEYTDGTTFELDLTNNPRIVEVGQVKFIAITIRELSRLVKKPLRTNELMKYLNKVIKKEGFNIETPTPPDLTWVDAFDVLWVLNRLYNAVFTFSS